MPSEHEPGGFWKDAFRPGTPACALLCGLVGVAVAVSFLSIGFWKTLLISACFIAGWIVGRNKFVRDGVSQLKRRMQGRDA